MREQQLRMIVSTIRLNFKQGHRFILQYPRHSRVGTASAALVILKPPTVTPSTPSTTRSAIACWRCHSFRGDALQRRCDGQVRRGLRLPWRPRQSSSWTTLWATSLASFPQSMMGTISCSSLTSRACATARDTLHWIQPVGSSLCCRRWTLKACGSTSRATSDVSRSDICDQTPCRVDVPVNRCTLLGTSSASL